MEASGKCVTLVIREGNPMARPRRVDGQKTAYERMENAFWEMLAEMPYHKMTCKELRSRADVSHNTFYYHFENMDDLAQKMFDRLAVSEVPAAIMAVATNGIATVADFSERVPGFETRFMRMRLLAASGSPFLMGLVRDSIVHAWLTTIGLSEDDLTPDDCIDITYAFGGITAIFGSELASNPQAIVSFSQREMGQAVIKTMRRLSNRKKD